MNIVFICGSFEPGRDGVGDYTRRLAQEMIVKGYKVGVIALNDKFIKEDFTGTQQSDSINIPVLRLPSHWLSTRRFQRSILWIDEFNPEWISIQFVPFSFHSKGLCFRLSKLLGKVGHGRRLHIMVHELWLGMDKEASLKFVLWGWLQKKLIKQLFTKIKPALIHTQSTLYKETLERIGFKVNLLPLFGNIPVETDKHIKKNGSESISFVLFGGIHAGAPVKDLVNELKHYSLSRDIEISLKILGHCGKEQLQWEKECRETGLSVEIFGEQSPQSISHVLSNSSFGISTTPAFLIEKSGSVAAMREHGLNVLCVARGWNPRGNMTIKLPQGVMQYKRGEIANFIECSFKSYSSSDVAGVTRQFLSNLLVN